MRDFDSRWMGSFGLTWRKHGFVFVFGLGMLARMPASLNQPPHVEGLGLFSGKRARLWFEPARVLSVRRAEDHARPIAVAPLLALARSDASWTGLHSLVSGAGVRNTTLWVSESKQGTIATCEHVLAALAGLSMWETCVVLADGPECPILDGSAEGFVELARASALKSAKPEPLVVRERVVVQDGHASIEALPLESGEAPSMSYELDYGAKAPWLASVARWDGTSEQFVADIARARTFSLVAEARAAQAAGMFTHLSAAEMLVFDERGVPIDNALRFIDEPARHKLLDLIGDLTLVGRPIHARIRAVRSGHALAAKFARAVMGGA